MVAFSGDTYSTVSSPIPELCLAYWYNLKHDVFMHPESVPDKRDRVLYLTGVDKWHMYMSDCYSKSVGDIARRHVGQFDPSCLPTNNSRPQTVIIRHDACRHCIRGRASDCGIRETLTNPEPMNTNMGWQSSLFEQVAQPTLGVHSVRACFGYYYRQYYCTLPCSAEDVSCCVLPPWA